MAPAKPSAVKLVVTGHARHGKDTVCELLRAELGLRFQSSSRFALDLFLFDRLRAKYGYPDAEACYADRVNHRAEWFDAISEFNAADGAALGKALLAEFDVYCGIRDAGELRALRAHFADAGAPLRVVWVDRSAHVAPEPAGSMNLTPLDADIVVSNNGSLEDLARAVAALARDLRPRPG